jgi:hypothetical protein
LRSSTHLAQQDRCSFVRLAEGLRPGDPVAEDRGCLDGVVDMVDRGDGPADAVEVVGLVKPLVGLAEGAVDGDGEVDGGSDQWSCRYCSRSRYSSRRA